MIRCRNCGKPVGAGIVRGGDMIKCASCSRLPGTKKQIKRLVDSQMRESRQEKASGSFKRVGK